MSIMKKLISILSKETGVDTNIIPVSQDFVQAGCCDSAPFAGSNAGI